MLRKKILIRGVVQAVGFRPFVYNSARANKLSGFVFNSGKGVVIEAQGAAGALQKFTRALQKNPPPLSKIESVKIQNIAVKKETGFKIKTTRRARAQTSAPADIAVCKNCKKDIAGVKNRRYRYAFANCTNCGPRYTIIKNLPYDRAQTTMARFKMCPACKAEFDNPKNRRFHAQPNCCPACGPRLEFIYKSKSAGGIEQAAQKIKEGKIIAIKSLGGFHLACNALDKTALARLRARKRRPHKPLALMAGDIKTIKKYCHVNAAEEQLLKSKEAPVVMLKKKVEIPLISDGLATTGFMLPYTPLHKILFDILGPRPLVMTSGNISGQPICIDNKEAQKTLAAVADGFLLHNRPIHNRMDDSVLFELNGKTHFLRRARGYAPGSLRLPAAVKKPTLALGGDLTSAFCLAKGDKAYLSQYIGDLDNAANAAYYKETLKKMRRLLNINPKVFVRDLHPNYFSAAFKPRATKAQHHLAHALSVAAEHNIKGRFLAFTFDGAGLGANGEIWGAEFLVINKNTWRKAGGFKPVQILGGDSAAEDIRKCAASYMLAAGLSAPKAAAIKDINS
ncbi:MAG: carbamoyltransferase HypF, partial [Elusimicrobiota bacterium]|nr:carbamoyltransferase HypF [Elusimicrobiota bacterium]